MVHLFSFAFTLTYFSFRVSALDWRQYAFDSFRSGYPDLESIITSNSFSANTLVPLWDVPISGGSRSQPLLSENVIIQGTSRELLFVGSLSGYYCAIDTSTGSIIWKSSIGAFSGSSCSSGQQTLGDGTGLIDKSSSSIFVVSSNGNLNRLLTTTGAQYSTSWPMVSIFDPSIYQSYGAIGQYGNTVYVPLSCRCSGSTTYQGKLLAFEIDPSSSFVYTQSFIPSSPYYGGGISGAGGVSINSLGSSPLIYMATSKSMGQGASQTSQYGESIIALTLNLAVQNSYTVGVNQNNYDFSSSPIIINPSNGCSQTLLATVNNAGSMYVTSSDLKTAQKIQISSIISDDTSISVSAPAFDSSTNMLYVTAYGTNRLRAYSLGVDCTLSESWRLSLSVDDGSESTGSEKHHWTSPSIAGGVIYVGSSTSNEIVAVDASYGTILWRSSSSSSSSSSLSLGRIYTPPIVVNGKIFVTDSSNDKIWAYELTPKSTGSQSMSADESMLTDDTYVFDDFVAATSNNFNVVIGSRTIDLKLIASNGLTRPDGTFIQRVFKFTTIDGFVYFFRLPVAGKPSTDAGLQFNGIRWDSPTTTDTWKTSADGVFTPLALGIYASTSLKQYSDGSINVQYTGGGSCSSGGSNDFTVTFKCVSSASSLVYDYFEKPTCHHHVNVSSSSFCSILLPFTKTPTAAPVTVSSSTSTPTKTPTRTPTVSPIAANSPTRSPSVTPTIAPVTANSPSRSPITSPTISPVSVNSPTRFPSRSPTATPITINSPTNMPVVATPVDTLSPVGSPTPRPSHTAEPSSVITSGSKAPFGVNTISAVPTLQPTTDKNSACISLALMDSFGDGWGKARLMIFPSVGHPYALAPGCGENVINSRFCFDPKTFETGDFVVIGVVGYKPAHYWEIFWQARNDQDGTVYSGSYTTSMTFVYKQSQSQQSLNDNKPASIGSISLMNQLPNEVQCRACEAFSGQIDENGFLSDSHLNTILQGTTTTTGGSEDGNGDGDVSLLHNKRNIGSLFDKTAINKRDDKKSTSTIEIGGGAIGTMSFSIYGEDGVWDTSDGYGTSFFIFDTTGQQIYYSGNLCGTEEGSCGLHLEDGEYSWRVSASGGVNVNWRFCGVRGDASTELIFSWERSVCTPLRSKTMTQLCTIAAAVAQSKASASSTSNDMVSGVVLDGSLILTSVTKIELTAFDKAVLQKAIAYELTDSNPLVFISSKQVQITSSQRDNEELVIQFQVTIQAEQFGVSTTSSSMDLRSQMDAMALDLRLYLQRSMSSGIFLARVKSMISAGLSTRTSSSTAGTGTNGATSSTSSSEFSRSESHNQDSYDGIDYEVQDAGEGAAVFFLEYATEVQLSDLYIDRQATGSHPLFNVSMNVIIGACSVFGVLAVIMLTAMVSRKNSQGVTIAERYSDLPVRSLHDTIHEMKRYINPTVAMEYGIDTDSSSNGNGGGNSSSNNALTSSYWPAPRQPGTAQNSKSTPQSSSWLSSFFATSRQ